MIIVVGGDEVVLWYVVLEVGVLLWFCIWIVSMWCIVSICIGVFVFVVGGWLDGKCVIMYWN